MDLSNISLDEYIKNDSLYLKAVTESENLRTVPLLNYVQLHECSDNSLVRFHGMIQDMIDPEIYLEKYELRTDTSERIQDGRYRDVLVIKPNETVNYESARNVHGERRSLFLVTIPGLNEWAVEVDREINTVATSQRINGAPCQPATIAHKRRIDEDDDAMDTEQHDGSAQKRLNTGNCVAETRNSALSAEYLLNSPIPSRPSKACIAKVYDDFDNFTLNTIVEVIGFLSVDPCLDGSTREPTDFEDISEIQASNPPPSLIPRLHCISVKTLNHFNPILDSSKLNDAIHIDIYKDLQLSLTQCLFGDAVAAEYLMCHLISHVYVRTDLQALGQFSLNLSHIPVSVLPEYTTKFYEILELLIPSSHMLPMTLENLNILQFTPKKDYETNKLTSGILQLAPHTHLVLDETSLLPGRLEQPGVEAVASIAHLIQQQKLKCNFQFYQLEFNADVPVLCLSEGKSMLPSNCHVPLRPDADCVALINETLAAVKHFLQPKLVVIRQMLTALKLKDFNMNPDNMEMIQSDFVEMRRNDPKVNAEDLHALLVLSRLLGLCQGHTALNGEQWERAKQLEQERKHRIN